MRHGNAAKRALLGYAAEVLDFLRADAPGIERDLRLTLILGEQFLEAAEAFMRGDIYVFRCSQTADSSYFSRKTACSTELPFGESFGLIKLVLFATPVPSNNFKQTHIDQYPPTSEGTSSDPGGTR